jgi:hypothetical protein
MSLLPSQFLLLAAILVFLGYALWVRTAVTDRLLYVGMAAVGVLLVLFPLGATRLANLVGIGRGADLIFYIFVLSGLFLSTHLLARLHQAERKITALTRRLALDEAAGGRGGWRGEERAASESEAAPTDGDAVAPAPGRETG